MEDKMFELMEKMYSDLTKKMDTINSEMKEVKTEIRQVKNQVTKIEVEHGQKLEALFDGYKQMDSKLDRIETQAEILTEKVDNHDVEIKVLQQAK